MHSGMTVWGHSGMTDIYFPRRVAISCNHRSGNSLRPISKYVVATCHGMSLPPFEKMAIFILYYYEDTVKWGS